MSCRWHPLCALLCNASISFHNLVMAGVSTNQAGHGWHLTQSSLCRPAAFTHMATVLCRSAHLPPHPLSRDNPLCLLEPLQRLAASTSCTAAAAAQLPHPCGIPSPTAAPAGRCLLCCPLQLPPVGTQLHAENEVVCKQGAGIPLVSRCGGTLHQLRCCCGRCWSQWLCSAALPLLAAATTKGALGWSPICTVRPTVLPHQEAADVALHGADALRHAAQLSKGPTAALAWGRRTSGSCLGRCLPPGSQVGCPHIQLGHASAAAAHGGAGRQWRWELCQGRRCHWLLDGGCCTSSNAALQHASISKVCILDGGNADARCLASRSRAGSSAARTGHAALLRLLGVLTRAAATVAARAGVSWLPRAQQAQRRAAACCARLAAALTSWPGKEQLARCARPLQLCAVVARCEPLRGRAQQRRCGTLRLGRPPAVAWLARTLRSSWLGGGGVHGWDGIARAII